MVGTPADTPQDIVRALGVAESCRFCRFLSDLDRGARTDEFVVEAAIGPEKKPLVGPPRPWYRVRFIIPRRFPYAVAETVPLDPPLRWNPHQNGDWLELGDRANVICPPRQSDTHLEELLLPYVRHAYRWISDAQSGTLVAPDQRYEFPHLLTPRMGDKDTKVYAEGGSAMLPVVRGLGHGRALLNRVKSDAVRDGLHRLVELRRPGRGDDPWKWNSGLREGIFGTEELAGWAAWAFVGDPVVEEPHRPAVSWEDLSDRNQRNVIAALRDASRFEHQLPLLLLAFAVPETWGGPPESVVWQAVDLSGFGPEVFERPNGFRTSSDLRRWPRVRRFLGENRDLRWLSCTDISKEAIAIRSGSSTGEDLSELRVAVLGVGAVGSVLAKSLSKLGLAHLLLVDKERLEPGNLVRHEGLAFQVEEPKVASMNVLLLPPHGTTVEGLNKDVIGNWTEVEDRLAEFDVIMDATGSIGVHEILSSSTKLGGKALAWCYVKPGPDFGLLALRRPGSSATLSEAERRLEEEVGTETWERFRAEADDRDRLVWPEPGCYHPTFRAPYHRLRMMSDALLTTLLAWLEEETGDLATLFGQATRDGRLGVESRIEAQVRW